MSSAVYDSEYWSECCIAPPLYDLHETGEYEITGICMSCRDHTSFKKMEDEDE